MHNRLITIPLLAVGVALLFAPAAQAGASGQDGRIVYGNEDTGQVFTANPDGTHLDSLPVETPGCLSWSPDGSRILTCVVDPSGLVRPAIIGADGSGLDVLDNPDPTLNIFCEAWSPDGLRLGCEAGVDGFSDRDGIYSVRSSDGGGLLRLTKNPFGLTTCCPLRSADVAVAGYSPDGSRVAFTRFNQHGQSAIFIVNTDGTGARQVTPWGLGASGGNWSRDGNWIVFGLRDFFYPQGQNVNRGRLFLVHPDGSGLHKIDIDTNGSWYLAKEPTWSPDGTRILFVMYLGSNGRQPDLFTMNPDGSHLTQVTDTPATENVPSWGTHPVVP